MKLIKAAQKKQKGTLYKDRHYFEVYDFHFKPLLNKKINLLEIGVANGGSLWMWKEYFKNSSIYGIDLNPECEQWEGQNVHINIGDQGNIGFLKDIGKRVGKFDIIIDDGSHMMNHQIISFNTLFHFLKDGGIYILEDLGTSYWPRYGGGIKNQLTCIERLKQLIDEIHMPHCRHDNAQSLKITTVPSYFELNISSVHFYNSMCFIYKKGHGFNPKSCDAITL